MPPAPGLLYIRAHKEIDFPGSVFNHQNDLCKGPSHVVLYNNTDTEKKPSKLLLLPLPDVAWLETEVGKELLTGYLEPTGWKEYTMRLYELVQKFEGQVEKIGRGKFVVAAANTPAKDTDAEFDEWYRKQHLDMLSLVRGYCRSTRYRLIQDYSHSDSGMEPFESAPRYLALHEFDDAETIDWDMLKMCARTEWSKRVVGGYARMDRDNWQLIEQIGDEEQML